MLLEMILSLLDNLVVALFVSSLVVLISKSTLLEPFRLWFFGKVDFIHNLLSCAFCLSWWLSALIILIFRTIPEQNWRYLMDTPIVAAMSAPLTWVVYKSHKAVST